jgi:hypothetical protein
MLSSAHAESMIRAMEASVQVRRRSQFFVWAQSCLQALLPHQVLVCGAYQRLRRELQFDVFQGVIVPPEALSLLGDARSALWRELVRCWVDGGARPVQVDTATLGRLIGETEATSLAGWARHRPRPRSAPTTRGRRSPTANARFSAVSAKARPINRSPKNSASAR